MAIQREWLVVAIGKLVDALVDDGRVMHIASRLVALAGKRLAHEYRPRRATGDFATMFEFVALADGRFHFDFRF